MKFKIRKRNRVEGRCYDCNTPVKQLEGVQNLYTTSIVYCMECYTNGQKLYKDRASNITLEPINQEEVTPEIQEIIDTLGTGKQKGDGFNDNPWPTIDIATGIIYPSRAEMIKNHKAYSKPVLVTASKLLDEFTGQWFGPRHGGEKDGEREGAEKGEGVKP